MVMEATPSPQSVGREFVRQYYTLLNKAPTHLHRFYNHQSSFVHGGLDPPNRETSPVVGQKQIHQKIQQLNFRDCHAKITQVDSQATLGSGVVVQVTGELSNAGQPMRRFTQTFVLAAQSPKKYYVHNDIFRYQDEIISDEECDTDARSEPEDDGVAAPERQHLNEVAAVQQLAAQQQGGGLQTYYANATGPGPIQQSLPPQVASAVPPPAAHHHHQGVAGSHVLSAQQVAQPPAVNGAVHPDDINVLSGQVPSHVASGQTQPLATPIPPTLQQQQANIVTAPLNPPAPIEEPSQVIDEPSEDPIDQGFGDNHDVEQEQEPETTEVSNEPKTWANLLKSPSDKPSIPYSGVSQGSSLSLTQPLRSNSPPSMNNQGLGLRNNQNNRGVPRISQQQQRLPRQDAGRGVPGRISINEDEDRRRPQGGFNNDINQLFLGNLPHSATEEDLREIFNEFGTILDLRVHSKPNAKVGGPGGRAPPNYGFITYETQQSVQLCLSAKPIFFPKDDKNGVILNVEEKKLKDRQPYSGGGRPMSDGNRGGPRGDNAGPRRGGLGGGPGGPNRNSAGGPGGQNNGPNNRNNNYNRSGGPPNRGQNTYNNRR